MSHPTVWRCRNCGYALGLVRGDGSLEVRVVGATAERLGLLRVPCPACGAVREWRAERPAVPPRRSLRE